MSKSFWHSHHRRSFPRVLSHPLLVEWLEHGQDCPSNLEVWGFEKSSYNFKDLAEYLDKKREKGKGKKDVKEKAAERGSKKKKGKNTSDSKKQVS